MAELTNVNYAIAQEGWGRISDLSFQTTGASNLFKLAVIDDSSGAGVTFDWGLDTSSGDGLGSSEALVFDPPRIDRLFFSLGIFAATAVTGDFVVSMVPESAPDLYSASALPGSRSEFEIFRVTRTTNPNVLTIFFLTPLGTLVTPSDGGSTYRDISAITKYLVADDWNGRLCLTLTWEPDTGIALFASAAYPSTTVVTSVEEQFHTGHDLHGARGRARMDDRLGLFASSKELVADGDRPGLAVFSWDRDPEDPPNRYRPSSREGAVDPEP